jgi:hypothetical protein
MAAKTFLRLATLQAGAHRPRVINIEPETSMSPSTLFATLPVHRLLDRETPDEGRREISPDEADTLCFKTESPAWDWATGGIRILNELPCGRERTHHRVHISDSIILCEVAEWQA